MSKVIDLENICLVVENLISIPIYDGQPIKEPSDILYAWTRIVDDNIFSRGSGTKVATIEFTFVGQPTINKQIREKIQELTDLLIEGDCIKVQEYNDFIAWNCSELAMR